MAWGSLYKGPFRRKRMIQSCAMISAIVLTRNDAGYIARTLKSLDWCDEVVIVDDDSTDETRIIAKKHKASVFVRSLGNDFAAQRNFGLSKAKGDWIVFID